MTDATNKIRTISRHANNMSKKAKDLLKKLGYVCIVFLYNPTGFSYYHWAKDFAWKESVSTSGFMAAGGLVLLGFSVFMVSSAWKMLEILGKIVVFPILIALSVAFAYTSWFNMGDGDHWTALILANIVLFVLVGAAYPRIKWAYFRTRQVSDADTGDDHEET